MPIMAYEAIATQEPCAPTTYTVADLSEIAGQLTALSECLETIDELRINAIRRGVAAYHINRLSEIAAAFRQHVAAIVRPLLASPESSEVTA